MLDNLKIDGFLVSNNNWFKEVFVFLADQKLVTKFFKENCSVFNYETLQPKEFFFEKKKFCNQQIFELNRSLLPFFGFPAYGVHCNGWRKKGKKVFMFLSKRSKNIEKFPGLYDNLVGGGQPSNISFRENLKKEAYEEVGLSKDLVKNAKINAFSKYSHVFNENLHSAVIATYDLEFKNNFFFNYNDGEVENVEEIEILDIFYLLEKEKIKPNCIIPILHFIIKNEKKFFDETALHKINKYLV